MSLILPSLGAFGYIPAASSGPTLLGSITDPVGTGGATISLTGLSLQENDLVMIHLACDNAIGSTRTSGYTDIYNDWSGGTPSYGCEYKIMGGTPDSSISVSGASKIMACIVQAWRGIDTTTPLDGVTPGLANSSDPPSITTNTAGAVSIIAHYLDDDDIAGTGSAPSGWVNFTQADTGQAQTDGNGATISTAYQIVGAAGAYDPGSFTGLNTDTERSRHFALRAAT